jgi:hypothetical protein
MLHATITESDKKGHLHLLSGLFTIVAGFVAMMALVHYIVL